MAPELVKHCEMTKDAARAMKLSVSGIKTIFNDLALTVLALVIKFRVHME